MDACQVTSSKVLSSITIFTAAFFPKASVHACGALKKCFHFHFITFPAPSIVNMASLDITRWHRHNQCMPSISSTLADRFSFCHPFALSPIVCPAVHFPFLVVVVVLIDNNRANGGYDDDGDDGIGD